MQLRLHSALLHSYSGLTAAQCFPSVAFSSHSNASIQTKRPTWQRPPLHPTHPHSLLGLCGTLPSSRRSWQGVGLAKKDVGRGDGVLARKGWPSGAGSCSDLNCASRLPHKFPLALFKL